MNSDSIWFVGIALGALTIPLLVLATRLIRVHVEDGENVLVLRFGRLAEVLTRPGLHWVLDRAMPWAEMRTVSLRGEYRHFRGIQVTDVRATSVNVEVFLEFRITDAVKACFAIADWDKALANLVTHAVTSILSGLEFQQILRDRLDLSSALKEEVAAETERWGIEIELCFVRKVSLLPEVSQEVLRSIAARLARAKADVEEEGRQRVALLEAETSAETAELVAEARAQYPSAVGRAFSVLKRKPKVFAAYNELYELSLLRPRRMVAFKGFGDGEVRAADAAMLTAPAHEPDSEPEPEPA